jgi:hypothetical protein
LLAGGRIDIGRGDLRIGWNALSNLAAQDINR